MHYISMHHLGELTYPFCPITGDELCHGSGTSEVCFWMSSDDELSREKHHSEEHPWPAERQDSLVAAWKEFKEHTIFDTVNLDLILKFLATDEAKDILKHDDYLIFGYTPDECNIFSLLDMTLKPT